LARLELAGCPVDGRWQGLADYLKDRHSDVVEPFLTSNISTDWRARVAQRRLCCWPRSNNALAKSRVMTVFGAASLCRLLRLSLRTRVAIMNAVFVY
jgi:hypothetical protein